MQNGALPKTKIRTAAFYRLYISANDLTPESLKDMDYQEINGVGHSLGETLNYTFNNLEDNKSYSVAIVAVDRWGNVSKPVIKKVSTKQNHAPEVTNFPNGVIEVNSNARKVVYL